MPLNYESVLETDQKTPGRYSLRYTLGCTCSSAGLPAFLDEARVIYPAGNELVQYNVVSQEMSFLPWAADCPRLRGIATSTSRKHAAMLEGESSGAYWQVAIINLQSEERVKTLSGCAGPRPPTCPQALCFSDDGKMLVAACGVPSPCLLAWQLSSGKLITRCPLPRGCNTVTCRPGNTARWTTGGDAGLWVWEFSEDAAAFREIASCGGGEDEPTAHAWLQNGLLAVGNGAGEVRLFNETEEVSIVPTSVGAIAAIAGLRQGFVVGGSRGGIAIYAPAGLRQRLDGNLREYRLTQEHHPAMSLGRPRHISVSPSEESLLLLSVGGGLGLLRIEADDDVLAFQSISSTHAVGTGRAPCSEPSKRIAALSELATCFHVGGVLDMAAAEQQPLLASLGTAKDLRIWNYRTRQPVLHQQMEDGVLCLAVHPLGYQLAIGSQNGLSLFYISRTSLVEQRSFAYADCTQVAFSHGGHLLAAACGGTRSIQILRMATLLPLQTLQAPASPVSSLCWSWDDARITCCTANSTCCTWSLHDSLYVQHNDPISGISGLAAWPDKGLELILRTAEGRLQTVDGAEVHPGLVLDAGQNLPILILNNCIIAACASGAVSECPLDGSEGEGANNGICTTVYSGLCPISHMVAVPELLLLASEEGALFILSQENTLATPPSMRTLHTMSLVSHDDLQALESKVQAMAAELRAARRQNEYQAAMHAREFADQLRQKEAEIEELKVLAEARLVEIGRQGSLGAAAVREAEAAAAISHTAELEALRKELTWQLQEEQQRSSRVSADLSAALSSSKQQLHEAEAAHAQALKTVIQDADRQVQQAKSQASSDREAAQRAAIEHAEVLAQYDAEIEDHFDRVASKFKTEQEDAEQRILELKGRNHLLKTAAIRLRNKESEDIRRIAQLEAMKWDLEAKVRDGEAAAEGMREQVRERENVIAQNYESIQVLRRRIADLEKHKFVLGYRSQELEKELEPKEAMIGRLREEIEEGDKDVLDLVDKQERLQRDAQARRLQAAASQKTAEALRMQLADRDVRIAAWAAELSSILSHGESSSTQRRKELQALLRKLSGHGHPLQPMDPTVQEEMTRQQQAVEMKNAILRKRVELSEELHRRAVREKLRENQGLLEDAARSRREVVALQRRIAVADLQRAQKGAEHVGDSTKGGCGDSVRPLLSWPDGRPASAGGQRHRTLERDQLAPRPSTADRSRRPSTPRRGTLALGSPARILVEAVTDEGRRLAELMAARQDALPAGTASAASAPQHGSASAAITTPAGGQQAVAGTVPEPAESDSHVAGDQEKWAGSVHSLASLLQWPDDTTQTARTLPRPWSADGGRRGNPSMLPRTAEGVQDEESRRAAAEEAALLMQETGRSGTSAATGSPLVAPLAPFRGSQKSHPPLGGGLYPNAWGTRRRPTVTAVLHMPPLSPASK